MNLSPDKTEITLDAVSVNTPEEAYEYALKQIKIDKVVISISCSRQNLATKNNNNYFASIALDTSSMYQLNNNDPEIRKSISNALKMKIEGAFALSRVSIKKEMEKDNIPIVNI